ncbi:MAG: helix-turn-helix domain-containing protein [Streptosporangiales bacterium]|nr:helix-turn-helix domain-containing protein [Streptosporangiales bacterium]
MDRRADDAADGAPDAAKPPRTIQSVERAHAVLTALARASGPLTAAQVAERTALNRTVAHRLLKTLGGLNLVLERRGRFELGPETLNLGYAYLDRLPVRRPALFYAVNMSLQAVQDHTLVISIAVPVAEELTIIDQVWGPNSPVDAILDIGTRLPLATSASGRAYLAYCPAEHAERLVGGERLDEIRPILEQVRGTRLSFSRDEVRAGIAAIASPVLGRDGHSIACINVSGKLDDSDLTPESEIARQVRRSAEWIERSVPSSAG